MTRLDEQCAQDMFGCSPLMGRDEVVETEDIGYGFFKNEVGACTCVGFVPLHDRGPLAVAHRPGSGIGEQIDVDVIRAKPKHVVSGSLDGCLPIFTTDPSDRFNGLDSEGLGGIRLHARLLKNVQ